MSENLHEKFEIWCASRSCKRPHRPFWTVSAVCPQSMSGKRVPKQGPERPHFLVNIAEKGGGATSPGGYLKNAPILGSRIRAQIELFEKLYEAFKTGLQFEAIFPAYSVNLVQNLSKGSVLMAP